MKTKITGILIAATLFAGLQQAQAADKEKYLIGGLLGGWILNEVFDSGSSRAHHATVEVHSRQTYCPPVVVERHVPGPVRPSGRYEVRQIREWVPGHYERVVERHGRVTTHWVNGHYVTRTQQVWVPYESYRPQGRYDSQRH
jgi:hypothetical protein